MFGNSVCCACVQYTYYRKSRYVVHCSNNSIVVTLQDSWCRQCHGYVRESKKVSLVDEIIKKQKLSDVELEPQTWNSETTYRYKESKFLLRFENIALEDQESMKIGMDSNKLYSFEFHSDLMGSIVPGIPIMRFQVLNSTKRASNAPVENWFSGLKTNKTCRMKCEIFIKLIREILSRSKEVLIDTF